MRTLIVLAVGLVASVSASAGTTYWVEPPPAGDDAHPGTSAEPWATLQHASDSVLAGDTVVVRSGGYVGFHVTTSGSATDPITFRADSGATVSITADNPYTPDGINVEGGDWIVIEGFTVTGRTRAGIRAVLCSHVTIRDNDCDANGTWGVFTGFCDDLLIEGNLTSNSVVEHGIYVSNSGDRPVIRGNLVVGNHANGIHMNGDASHGGDGIISDALIEGNVIRDNGAGGGSGINCDGVQGSLIRNNLIVDSHASGISLYRIDGGGPSSGNRVLNNTVLVAADGRWALNVQDGSAGATVRNNVFHSEHSFRGAMSVCAACLTGFDSDHNAVEDRFTLDDGDTVLTLAQWRVQTGQDAASFAVTPAGLFRDPPDDHHPSASSPLLDAGELRADVPTDLEGTPRPLGPTHDIGAYEGTGVVFADGFETEDTSRWSDETP